MTKITVFTDGGSRGNPGPSGAGAVVYDAEKNILVEIAEFLGTQTNNWAEYEAIVLSLKKLKEMGLEENEIEFKADSKLAVEQLMGNWKVKNENVRGQFNKVKKLLVDFKNVKFTHVRREYNKEADMLANKAMDLNK